MSLRISDNASLIHFTFIRSPFHWGQNVGHQNCAYLELLSSLNVVLYICETLSVKKMKTMPKRESGTSRDGVWPVENHFLQVTVTRTNQNSGPLTHASY